MGTIATETTTHEPSSSELPIEEPATSAQESPKPTVPEPESTPTRSKKSTPSSSSTSPTYNFLRDPRRHSRFLVNRANRNARAVCRGRGRSRIVVPRRELLRPTESRYQQESVDSDYDTVN